MDIKSTTDNARMLTAYFTRKKLKQQVQPFETTITDVKEYSPAKLFTPESQGVKSEYLMKFYRDIENKKELALQTVTIARNGCVISKGDFYPYKREFPSETHSFSKSIVSLAVGVAISQGILDLDTTLGEIFSEEIKILGNVPASKLKIRHLLTMSTGVQFNEMGAVTDNFWIKSYLSSGVKFRAGTAFDYNSMNSYMLSAAIVRKTGRSLSDFLKENIFSPLEITDFYWEKSPEGIEKGGWGLYILPDDAIKFGWLILQNGMYNGKRVISENWIKESTSIQIKTPPITGVYNYGYHMWIDENDDEVLFNGMFGRNLHIFRKTKTVVYLTAMNGDLFQRCTWYNVVKKYFGKRFVPYGVLADDALQTERLRNAEKKLSCVNSLYRRYAEGKLRSDGISVLDKRKIRSFEFDINQTRGISILPTMSQAIHNNFRPGIKRLEFKFESESVQITVTEEDCLYTFNAGYLNAEESVVKIGCEEYRISSLGEFTRNEDDIPILKLNVSFLQLSNSRYFKIYFYDEGLHVECYETPGADFVSNSFKMIVEDSLNPALVERTKKALDSRIFKSRLDNFLKPEFNSKY